MQQKRGIRAIVQTTIVRVFIATLACVRAFNIGDPYNLQKVAYFIPAVTANPDYRWVRIRVEDVDARVTGELITGHSRWVDVASASKPPVSARSRVSPASP